MSLIGSRNRCREFFQRQSERAVLWFLREDRVHLDQDFFQQIFRRHALIVYAGEHVIRNLAEGRWNLAEPRDVIVVVLRAGESQPWNKLRQRKMKAVELIDGHLPWLECGFYLVLGELADHQVPRQNLLLRQTRSVDRAQAQDVVTAAREPLVVGLDGVVRELIVEAVVADGRGKLGRVAEAILPDLGEQVIESLAASGCVRSLSCGCGLRRGLRDGGCGTQKKQKRCGGAEFHHSVQRTRAACSLQRSTAHRGLVRRLHTLAQHGDGFRQTARAGFGLLRLRDPADVFLAMRVTQLLENGQQLFFFE